VLGLNIIHKKRFAQYARISSFQKQPQRVIVNFLQIWQERVHDRVFLASAVGWVNFICNLLTYGLVDSARSTFSAAARCCRAGLSNAALVIYFPGALIYSACFNFNQNFKKKNISEKQYVSILFVALP
jgi:hypothetical protein